MENRIAEHRVRAGMSMRELGKRIGKTGSTINKLEKGETRLGFHRAKQFAAIFGVEIGAIAPEFAAAAQPAGSRAFQEEPAGYDAGPAAIPSLDGLPADAVTVRVRDHALDQIGLLPGDVAVVDPASQDIANLATGDVVAVLLDGELVLRQFVGPAMLITNSSQENTCINLRATPIAVRGVMVSSHRSAIRQR